MAVFGSDELQGEFQGWRVKIADRGFWEQLETLLLIAWSSEMFLAYNFVTEGITVPDYQPEMPKHTIHLVWRNGRLKGPLCGKGLRGT